MLFAARDSKWVTHPWSTGTTIPNLHLSHFPQCFLSNLWQYGLQVMPQLYSSMDCQITSEKIHQALSNTA